MGEIARMSISKFKATAKGGMELPVMVTVDGEDVFAVVPVGWLAPFVGIGPEEALMEAQRMLAVPLAKVKAEWVPPDLARDT